MIESDADQKSDAELFARRLVAGADELRLPNVVADVDVERTFEVEHRWPVHYLDKKYHEQS